MLSRCDRGALHNHGNSPLSPEQKPEQNGQEISCNYVMEHVANLSSLEVKPGANVFPFAGKRHLPISILDQSDQLLSLLPFSIGSSTGKLETRHTVALIRGGQHI